MRGRRELDWRCGCDRGLRPLGGAHRDGRGARPPRAPAGGGAQRPALGAHRLLLRRTPRGAGRRGAGPAPGPRGRPGGRRGALAGLRAPGAPDGPAGGQRACACPAPPGGARPRSRVAGGGRLAWPPSALAAGGPARGARPGWPAPGGAGVAAAPAGLPDRRAGRGGAPLGATAGSSWSRCRTTWSPPAAGWSSTPPSTRPGRPCSRSGGCSGWAERARPPRRACPGGRLRRWGRGPARGAP